jgi:nicotinic acetylcholine receptor, invertebrate
MNQKVKEEWQYIAHVIDRLFLWIFTSACVIGTVSIILQAPSFYDKVPPIDEKMSNRF